MLGSFLVADPVGFFKCPNQILDSGFRADFSSGHCVCLSGCGSFDLRLLRISDMQRWAVQSKVHTRFPFVVRCRVDRAMQQRHLTEAERHIVEGQRHIAQQERLIAHLQDQGHDTATARTLLASFRLSQEQHVAHRDRILRELAE